MDEFPILLHIESPQDLQALPAEKIKPLCREIREFLVRNVSKTGGHLASNLGAVEMTVALHRVYDSASDRIVFDVGHQCYVHKLLTGRRDRFSSLRQFGGLSGFPKPSESAHDAFIAGHASTSVSVGLGMARARTARKETYRVVCVLGDGAMTGGLAYEALNDAGQSGEPIVVILNDNEMSIDRNVGGLAKRLTNLRCRRRYLKAKERVKVALSGTAVGRAVISGLRRFKAGVKALLLPGSVFEQMGFYYLGPADGHDEATVERLLRYAASLDRPVLLHLKTVKGKGYSYAEKRPEKFHGVSPFDPQTGLPLACGGKSFSQTFGEELCRLARVEPRLHAVTAAMTSGTGLTAFSEEFPDRFHDVGIAEAHAVTMSSAMAFAGLYPVCAVYSSFLQRAYDSLIHDAAILHLPVLFAVDRAGIVGEDGETHNGVFDVAMLSSVPGLEVWAPGSFAELETAMRRWVSRPEGPCVLRYSRGGEERYRENHMEVPAVCLREGRDITLAVYGILTGEVLEAADMLEKQGVSAEVVKINRLAPLNVEAVACSVEKTGRLIVAEDVVEAGGIGRQIEAALSEKGIVPRFIALKNTGNRFLPAGSVAEIRRFCGIDARSVCQAATEGCAQ